MYGYTGARLQRTLWLDWRQGYTSAYTTSALHVMLVNQRKGLAKQPLKNSEMLQKSGSKLENVDSTMDPSSYRNSRK